MLSQVQAALTEQASQYAALTEELRNGAAEDLQGQLQAAQAAAAEATREMEGFKTQLQERAAAVTELEAQVERLKAAQEGQATEELASLQAQLQAAQAAAAAAEAEKQKLLTELSEWQDAVGDLESEVERQKGAAATLTTQLEQLRAPGDESDAGSEAAVIARLHQELGETQQRLEEATQRSERLQEEVRAKEEGLRSLKQQMEEQKVAVENLGQKSAANADQVCATVWAKERVLGDTCFVCSALLLVYTPRSLPCLSLQLGRLQSAVAKRDIELAESRDMLAKAERELAAAVSRAEELEVAVDAARREHESQADALARELQDTRDALADLQSQLNTNDRSLADEAARLRQELVSKDEELATAGTAVDALSEELSTARGALSEAEARLERAQGDADAAREEADEARVRVQEVEAELRELRGLRDEVSEQGAALNTLQVGGVDCFFATGRFATKVTMWACKAFRITECFNIAPGPP